MLGSATLPTNSLVLLHPTYLTGRLDVLDYLINELGMDPVARDKVDMSSVHAATQGGQLSTVKVCTKHTHTYIHSNFPSP